jgi:Cysteine-rich domain
VPGPSRSSDHVEETKIKFLCNECGMSERVHYYGKNPPFVKNIEFLEDTYIMKDPFAPPPTRNGKRSYTEYFLSVGAHCFFCKNSFCKDCSIYFNHTFCFRCAHDRVSQFPLEVQSKIRKGFLEINDKRN